MKKLFGNSNRPRVALLVESSRAYGRGTVLGVAKYVREHGHWSIFLQEQSLCDEVPDWLRTWKGDGLITRMENDTIAGLIHRLGAPAVSLRDLDARQGIPCVLTDNIAVAVKAFEHLQERGFRHYAFCGFNGADYSDERRDSFVRSVTEAGLRCHVYEDARPPSKNNTAKYEEVGLRDGERVGRWIKELPKPIGLMACNDMRGQQVLNACRAMGVSVPDEVAVIGADNDEVLCDLSDPPLSSVVPNTERIGYEAAALLDQMMMKGKRPAQSHIFIEPSAVVTRRSTEVLAVEDRQIAAAARFIREHACEGIDVGNILRAVPLSRSTLERRFSKIMGRSPKDEILRVRLNRAKQLLTETDLSLAMVAEKIGLEHTEYLSVIFKKKTGLTPAQFRSRSRSADAADRLLS